MITAEFQAVAGDSVGIVRVYPTPITREPAPYKFFTVAVINNGIATLHGLCAGADIKIGDIRAIGRELAPLGVKKLTWTHQLKTHEFIINDAAQ